MARRRDKCGATNDRYHGDTGSCDGEAGAPYAHAVTQQGIADYGEREAGMPYHVQPSGGLWSGTNQPGGSKQTRKAQCMGHGHKGREQITARKEEQRRRTENDELG